MANYNDLTVGSEWVAVPVAPENTIIWPDGPIRITSHSSPNGNTLGIPVDRDEAYPVSADVALYVRSDRRADVTLVRNSG